MTANPSETEMSNISSVKRFVVWAAIFACIFFVSMLVFFFCNLGTTTSQYSAGGITAPHQLFYNFMHDRLFQTSLFASEQTGQSVGFSYNPYAYLHIYAIHAYLSSFLFAPVWNFWPNLSWLYGLVILINYFGMALFAWKTLKYLSPKSCTIKTVFAVAILLSSGFLFTFQQNGQLLLFGGPFILAAYYFLLTRQRALFLVSMVLLCLISEDAAMVAITFAAYIFLFERNAKSYALAGGLFAMAYLVLVLLVIQPAARSHLVLSEINTTVVVVKHILAFDPSLIRSLLIGFFPALFFLPAFAIACVLFGKPGVSWLQVSGLVLIAPLPHWGECAIVGATHHLMPVIVFMFAAFILVLGRTPDIQSEGLSLSKRKMALLFCLAAIFLAGSFRTLISNLPEQILLPLYKSAGMADKAQKIEGNFAEQKGNRRVIEIVETVPKENSLVYLTNSSVEGFIAGRSDIWAFPDQYDLADYLIIQPNARQSFYSIPEAGNQSIAEAISRGKYVDGNAVILQESVNAIVHYLVVEKQSHRVAVNEPEVVLLERIKKHQISFPPSTAGLGWIDGLFRSNGAKSEHPKASRNQ